MLREVGSSDSCCVCLQKAACPVLSWDLSPDPGGKDPALPSPSLGGQERAPRWLRPAQTCAPPAPPTRAHAPRAPAFAHLRAATGGARARSSPLPPHPPLPRDLLFCLQTQPPASFPATKAPPPGSPAFHPGPRTTRAARRRVPGRRPRRQRRLRPRAPPTPGPARPPSIGDRQRARSPGAALPPRASASGSRRRRRARAAQVKEEKKGGKNRKRRWLQQRSAAALGQAGRRTREPATQGRGCGHPGRAGLKKKVAAAAATQGRRLEGRVERAGGGCAASRSLEPPGAGRRARGRRRLQEQRRRRRRRRRHLLLT